MKYIKNLIILGVFVLALFITTSIYANTIPDTISVTINGANPNPIFPDGVKTHNIKLSSQDVDGANTIAEQLLLLNYQGPNAGQYRGYFGWSNQGFKYFGANVTQVKTCTGGGQAAIYSKTTYGAAKYMTLNSCTSTISGVQRITTFVVSFTPEFTKPYWNYFSAYTEDNQAAKTGWEQMASANLDLPYFGMTVPSQGAVSGQISNVEKFANSYPNFAWLSDWWNGNDAAGIISNKCDVSEYLPMIYSTTSAEPPAACKDGRPIILGNECEQSGQCNSTEDQEYAMWQRFRTWPGPVILCNNLVTSLTGSALTRCSNLLARYKTQYGSLPANAYLGIHIYATYNPVGSDYQYTLPTSLITSYYNLSTQYNLKRYVGEWGFVYWNETTENLSTFVIRDMDNLVGNVMTTYNPDIMMYYTTRDADNAPFSINTLFNANGTKTSVGTRFFNLYYQ